MHCKCAEEITARQICSPDRADIVSVCLGSGPPGYSAAQLRDEDGRFWLTTFFISPRLETMRNGFHGSWCRLGEAGLYTGPNGPGNNWDLLRGTS